MRSNILLLLVCLYACTTSSIDSVADATTAAFISSSGSRKQQQQHPNQQNSIHLSQRRVPFTSSNDVHLTTLQLQGTNAHSNTNDDDDDVGWLPIDTKQLKDHPEQRRRRQLISSMLNIGGVLLYVGGTFLDTTTNMAVALPADDMDATPSTADETFASIAERANKMSKEVDATNPQSTRRLDSMLRPTNQTIYDFTLPIAGVATPIADIIRQEFYDNKDVKVKAIIVVNIKQDDPVARKTIPELIALATKYSGRNGENQLAIIACPTDQGYYEPDTSQLIRLKIASEYGYGINPSTIISDKVNLLGTGAVPLWRWIQNVCRTPSGLGRIQGNYEKFLIDGRTGLPVRRYPRKYRPLNMMDDIDAIIQNKPMSPPQAGYLEEWRMAIADSERDTYRFEKGLNVFDQ